MLGNLFRARRNASFQFFLKIDSANLNIQIALLSTMDRRDWHERRHTLLFTAKRKEGGPTLVSHILFSSREKSDVGPVKNKKKWETHRVYARSLSLSFAKRENQRGLVWPQHLSVLGRMKKKIVRGPDLHKNSNLSLDSSFLRIIRVGGEFTIRIVIIKVRGID